MCQPTTPQVSAEACAEATEQTHAVSAERACTEPAEETHVKSTEECCVQPDETGDFFTAYATPELRQTIERRASGDKASRRAMKRLFKRVLKAEEAPMAAYLKQPNDNPALERCRKRYHRNQTLSWVALALCAVVTLAVLLCLFLKPELLQSWKRDAVICAVALLFSGLTWLFSYFSNHCAKRMVEIELVLRTQPFAQAAAEESESAVEDPEQSAQLPAESASEEPESPPESPEQAPRTVQAQSEE